MKESADLEVQLSSISPAKYNPRKTLKPTDRAWRDIKRSIEHFGLVDPLVWNKRTGNLVGGHQRYAVLKSMGVKTTRVRVVDLGAADEKALNIALNRITGEWDFHKLEEVLVELDTGGLDIEITGFNDLEIKEMVDFEKVDEGDGSEPNTGEIIEPPKNPVTKKGTMWTLGDHRLLCGDCREPADLKYLTQGVKLNLVVTSPPYAAQRKYDDNSGFRPILPEAYSAWFEAVQRNIAQALAPDGSFFLNIKEHCEDGQRHPYVKELVLDHVNRWGWRFVDEFAWVHGGTPKGVINRFKNGWEPVFQLTRGPHKFRPDAVRHKSEDIPDWEGAHPSQNDGLKMQKKPGGGAAPGGMGGHQGAGLPRGGIFQAAVRRGPNMAKNQGKRAVIDVGTKEGLAYPSNVLSVGKNREALGHGAAYPVGLPEFFIKAYTDKGDTVFDPFMGSGTTMAAAELHRRRALGTEISPAYCDIIVHRWETMTKKKAVNEGIKGRTK